MWNNDEQQKLFSLMSNLQTYNHFKLYNIKCMGGYRGFAAPLCLYIRVYLKSYKYVNDYAVVWFMVVIIRWASIK